MVQRTWLPVRTPGGLQLTEGVHEAGSGIPWHLHETPTICYVRRGAFREYLKGREILCPPASVKFTPAGERHANRFDLGDARGVMVEVEAGFAESLHPLGDVLDEPVQFAGGVVSGIATLLARELDRPGPPEPAAVEGWVVEMVSVASRRRAPGAGRGGPWLSRAREILHAEFHRPLGLAALARRVEVHPVTLARGFRRAYGCPVGEYQRRLRLDWAAEQLLGSEETVGSIAAAAGFADQSHFCRVFRRETGQAPIEWRGGRVPARDDAVAGPPPPVA